MTQSRIDIQIKTADSWYALYNVAAIEFQLSDWKTSCLIVGIDENFNQSHYFHINYFVSQLNRMSTKNDTLNDRNVRRVSMVLHNTFAYYESAFSFVTWTVNLM